MGGNNLLPIYKGHFVDARLRQFHLFRWGKLPSIIPFDSPKGKKWLAEMRQKGLSIEPVPYDRSEGQKLLKEHNKLKIL